ncbi:MAG: non-hydrolyzing UDP-N-acetylglucosamine 2-epimerase [bacterium]
MKKVATIVGARPQFIKVAPLSREIREAYREVIIHTGQHYDENMSRIFFDELGIPMPDYNLGVGSASHGRQTGEMLIGIEEVLLKEGPDIVLVYGDTNSTVAGALAACKLHIPVGHVEAGLRSHNRRMPEEINRILTDHASDLLFCPTQTAVDNLRGEGIKRGVYLTGDIMLDALLFNIHLAEEKSHILDSLELRPGEYLLATVHRAENTDSEENLGSIASALLEAGETVIFPVHPRTRKRLGECGLLERIGGSRSLRAIDPVGYLDMLVLEKNARAILTDSGGVQKEAYFLKVPCITLRNETEWVETVSDGWNILVGSDKEKILGALKDFSPPAKQTAKFGNGRAGKEIRRIIDRFLQ